MGLVGVVIKAFLAMGTKNIVSHEPGRELLLFCRVWK
jgi:hypothetical protein